MVVVGANTKITEILAVAVVDAIVDMELTWIATFLEAQEETVMFTHGP